MLLPKAIVLLGIATSSAFALDNELDTLSTLSTKYIDHYSSGEETTVSTTWRTHKASATTQSDGDDDGWTFVSEMKPTQTNIQQTTTINGTVSEATYVRPNNAIVAHRMAVFASKEWGRFPTRPDAETDVSWLLRFLRAVLWFALYNFNMVYTLSKVYPDHAFILGMCQQRYSR
jgi:hypothetical protein